MAKAAPRLYLDFRDYYGKRQWAVFERDAYDMREHLPGQIVSTWTTKAAAKSYMASKRRGNPSKRKNPGTKAERAVRAQKERKKRGIAGAVKDLLKKVNPSAAITGASVVKLKGGALKITPMRGNASGVRYGVQNGWHASVGSFTRRADAIEMAKRMRAANKQAGLRDVVKVVKVK